LTKRALGLLGAVLKKGGWGPKNRTLGRTTARNGTRPPKKKKKMLDGTEKKEGTLGRGRRATARGRLNKKK